ncbi:MAG: 16S rRNA (cytidine(1402)-2'-O)-methyltransferase [Gammaproteobacteria bacterium]|nr:16S rRNA (cytidine(1402)-2'-O)-methyltransferase [Gammaproteobacteria bacterium]
MVEGTLYVVATPIGNLGDMSARALEILSGVDVIAAEDTRHSRQLLRHFGIGTPLVALHEHNERAQVEPLIERLRAGQTLALVSDAGTPIVSDPGYHLVRAVHAANGRVVSIPGPSAVIAALSVSGQSAERFVFEGFLPARPAARLQRLEALRHEGRTLVFFEAPHRVVDALEAMARVFGAEREVTYVRELSKLYETARLTRLGELLDWVRGDPLQRKGEIVIVVHGADEAAAEDARAGDDVLGVLLEELPLKQAVTLAAKLTGLGRNRLYEVALRLEKDRAKIQE